MTEFVIDTDSKDASVMILRCLDRYIADNPSRLPDLVGMIVELSNTALQSKNKEINFHRKAVEDMIHLYVETKDRGPKKFRPIMMWRAVHSYFGEDLSGMYASNYARRFLQEFRGLLSDYWDDFTATPVLKTAGDEKYIDWLNRARLEK